LGGGFHVSENKSFTLVELLVVIGILAVLTTAVVIILNPSDYLAQARDSRRMQDLSLLNNSLQNLEAIDPTISFGTSLTVYVSIPDDASSTCGTLGLPALPATYTYNCVSTANLTKTNGTGWVPVNFTTQSIVQLSALPIDPTNTPTDGLYYTYIPGGSYELNTILESNKYRLSGDKDRTSSDGGDSFAVYEIGTNKTLNPIKDSGLVGYWKFDGGTSGSISNNQTTGFEDFSSNNNGGTAKNTNGTGMSWAQGKVGGAVSFDGADDYVNLGSLDNLSGNSETVSFWQNAYSRNDFGSSVDSSLGGSEATIRFNIGYYYSVSPHFSVFIGNGSSAQSFSFYNTIPLGTWEHYIVVLDGSNLKVFLNGTQLSSTENVAITLAQGIYGIAKGSGGAGFFNGLIDDVRIYDRALSVSEIKAIYNATK